MLRGFLLACIAFSFPALLLAKNGLLELDQFSFDKVLNKFDVALVKFDVAYPYGEKHDVFSTVALEARELDDLIVADVNVKDYGEKDNEALAEKYGALHDNFPAVRLFIKGRKDPVEFDRMRPFTAGELQRFVMEESGVYMALPGCVSEMDGMTTKFMEADPDDRHLVLLETEQLLDSLPEKHITSGGIYVLYMKKILEQGEKFVTSEMLRLHKLAKEKMSMEKKKLLERKINILRIFEASIVYVHRNDEL